jgi:pimeloyl-ACP methyl ester carboxylesterase
MIVRFGDCELDVEGRELRRARIRVHVEPQVFDLLAYLIAHRERAVGKDEIVKEVWRGRIVSDATLSSRINAVRQAVGDTGKTQTYIRTLPRRGFRFVGDLLQGSGATPVKRHPIPPQQVTFCRTPDGVNLAVAVSGDGLPVVKTGTWLTNVERDWQSPLWSPLFSRLSSQFRLVRYDPRGCGLSDWDAPRISFDAFVSDLETVVDSLRLERFALFGISQGAAVSVAYTARHPERVSRLALSGGFPRGWRKQGSADEINAREAVLTLIKHGWGQDNPAFRQVFNLRLWPDLAPDQMVALDELQRISTSPDNAIRILRAIGDLDVTALLPQVSAPTLVLHSRGDVANPIEYGLMLARGIPRASFVEIDSRNHIPLSHEPTWGRYVDELCAFLNDDR